MQSLSLKPQVHTFAEAGEIIMGGFGRELFATAQILFLGLYIPY